MALAVQRSSPLPPTRLQKSRSDTQLSRTGGNWAGSPTRNGPLDPFRVTADRVPVAAVKDGPRPRTLSPMLAMLPKQRPMFTGRMVMQGYWGLGPSKAGVFRKRLPPGVFDKHHIFEANPAPATEFRRFYERGDIPICVRHGANPTVEWKVEPERLDYGHYLPIFFDGLVEKAPPYNFMAYQGLQDLLHAARGKDSSVLLPIVPQLIVPMKRALNTKDNEVVCRCINIIQLLVKSDERVGDALVPYYRQILPVFNLFRRNNLNLGDGIEYSQRKRENMGDLIQETLELFERTGGEDAFINIKYMIPTYESVMQ